MFAILSKLIPVRDYFYAAAVVAAVVWYNIHVHNLEVGYAKQKTDAIVAAVSQAQSAAKKIADQKEKQYAIARAQVEEQHAKDIQAADATHAADLERVRQLTAKIRSGSVPSGPSGPGTGADAGAISAAALGSAAELADALRHDDASLQQCWGERDALTGK